MQSLGPLLLLGSTAPSLIECGGGQKLLPWKWHALIWTTDSEVEARGHYYAWLRKDGKYLHVWPPSSHQVFSN